LDLQSTPSALSYAIQKVIGKVNGVASATAVTTKKPRLLLELVVRNTINLCSVVRRYQGG
jgi:hypothetical protein